MAGRAHRDRSLGDVRRARTFGDAASTPVRSNESGAWSSGSSAVPAIRCWWSNPQPSRRLLRGGARQARSQTSGGTFILANHARSDGRRLRRVEPVAQATRELAVLVRARTALVEAAL